MFQKPSSLKILGARMVTQNKFQAEDPQISGVTIENLVAWVTGHPGIVHPSFNRCVK